MIFGKKVKPNKRTTLVPESGMHAVGFYVDVSSFVEDDEINFYLEMSKEDLTISTDDGTELITPLTLAHFTKDLGLIKEQIYAIVICTPKLFTKVLLVVLKMIIYNIIIRLFIKIKNIYL